MYDERLSTNITSQKFKLFREFHLPGIRENYNKTGTKTPWYQVNLHLAFSLDHPKQLCSKFWKLCTSNHFRIATFADTIQFPITVAGYIPILLAFMALYYFKMKTLTVHTYILVNLHFSTPINSKLYYIPFAKRLSWLQAPFSTPRKS